MGKDKKIEVTFLPSGKKVTFYNKSISLKEAIKRAGINFPFPCGGKGLCGKCRVKITGKVNPPTAKEKETISHWLEKGYRLACQTTIKENVEVEIPVSSLISTLQILTEDSGEIPKVDPFIQKVYLPTSPPTLENQISDISRIKEQLKERGFNDLKVELDLIRKIPSILRKSKFKVTAVLNGKEIITVEKGDTRGEKFGLAFDIGTTTIVGTLIDLDTGDRVANKAILNPQIPYGDDVISRISYLQTNPKGLRELQKKIVGGINEIIQHLTETNGIRKDNIYEAIFLGNTVMQHFLAGINPLNLALYPYVPVVQESISIKSSRLGIKINPGTRVYIFPSIAAFVGGDTVGVILATGLHQVDKKIRLAVDIGTNGEIVISRNGKLVVASTAAGPAFEGARISQGMWAQKGAIEKVKLKEGEVMVEVIGGGEPQGICGSGLVDAVSELYREGIIDNSGRIKPRKEQSKLWQGRIKEENQNSKFILVERKDDVPIFISQKDIREFQLAKAAICAGIKILLKTLGIKEDEVEEVLIAGAFGNYINLQSAYRVGLFPFFPAAEVKAIGNAASMGAIKALICRACRHEAERIPSLAHYVELAAQPDFQNILAESLFLGKVSPV